MPLIKQDRILTDGWLALDDGALIPDAGDLIVSLATWRAERDRLLARGRPLGLRLQEAEALEVSAEELSAFALIALVFPKFTDGRAYSAARTLRGRLGFRGELRAVGHVLPDQLHFMARCGFDAFALPETVSPVNALAHWRRAEARYSVLYQRSADGAPSALERRHGIRSAAA